MKESNKDQMERWYVWLLVKRNNQKRLSSQFMISHSTLGLDLVLQTTTTTTTTTTKTTTTAAAETAGAGAIQAGAN